MKNFIDFKRNINKQKNMPKKDQTESTKNVKNKTLVNFNDFFSTKNKILIKFFISILIKNRIIISFSIMIIFAQIFMSIFLIDFSNINVSILNKSFLIFILPALETIFLIIIGAMALLIETKKNNIDIEIFTKAYKKTHVFICKQISLIILNSINILLLLSSVLIFIIGGLSISTGLAILFSGIFTSFLFSFLFVPIISFLSIFFNNVSNNYLVISLLTLLLSFSSLGVILINNNNDNSTKNNLKRFNVLSNNGSILKSDLVYGDQYFESPDNNHKFSNNLPILLSSPFLSNLINASFSLNQKEKIDLLYKNNNLSIINHNINLSKLNDYKEPIYTQFTDPEVKSVFDYKLKKNLFSDIKKELLSNIEINELLSTYKYNLSNYPKNAAKTNNDMTTLANNLKSNYIWRTQWTLNINYGKNLSKLMDLKSFLINTLGINNSESLIYQIFKNYELVNRRFSLNGQAGLKEYISHEFFPGFSDLFSFLINSNLGEGSNAFGEINSKFKENIEKYHKTYSELDFDKKISRMDSNYIKNYIFDISYDNKNNVTAIRYRIIPDSIKTSNSSKLKIMDEKDWNYFFGIPPNGIRDKKWINNYFYNLTPRDISTTYQNYSHSQVTLSDKIKDMSQDPNERILYPIYLKNNSVNFNALNNTVNIYSKSKDELNYLYFVLLLLIAIPLQYVSIKKTKEGDLI